MKRRASSEAQENGESSPKIGSKRGFSVSQLASEVSKSTTTASLVSKLGAKKISSSSQGENAATPSGRLQSSSIPGTPKQKSSRGAVIAGLAEASVEQEKAAADGLMVRQDSRSTQQKNIFAGLKEGMQVKTFEQEMEDKADKSEANRLTMQTRQIYSMARQRRLASLDKEDFKELKINVDLAEEESVVSRKSQSRAQKSIKNMKYVVSSTRKTLQTNRLMDQFLTENLKNGFSEALATKSYNLAVGADWEHFNKELDELIQEVMRKEAEQGKGRIDLANLKECGQHMNALLDKQLDTFDELDNMLQKLKDCQKRLFADPDEARQSCAEAQRMVNARTGRLHALQHMVMALSYGGNCLAQDERPEKDGTSRKLNVQTALRMVERAKSQDGATAEIQKESAECMRKLGLRFGSEKANELKDLMLQELKGEAMQDAVLDELIEMGVDVEELGMMLSIFRKAALAVRVEEAVNELGDETRDKAQQVFDLAKKLEGFLPENLTRQIDMDKDIEDFAHNRQVSQDGEVCTHCGANLRGLGFCLLCGTGNIDVLNIPAGKHIRKDKGKAAPSNSAMRAKMREIAQKARQGMQSTESTTRQASSASTASGSKRPMASANAALKRQPLESAEGPDVMSKLDSAAACIQAHYRGHSTRNSLASHGIKEWKQAPDQRPVSEQCSCGNITLLDSVFCRKCGMKQQEVIQVGSVARSSPLRHVDAQPKTIAGKLIEGNKLSEQEELELTGTRVQLQAESELEYQAELERTATRVQACFRGKNSRKSLKLIPSTKTDQKQADDQVEETEEKEKLNVWISMSSSDGRSYAPMTPKPKRLPRLRGVEQPNHPKQCTQSAACMTSLEAKLRQEHLCRQRASGRHARWSRSMGPVHGAMPPVPVPDHQPDDLWQPPLSPRRQKSPDSRVQVGALLVEEHVSGTSTKLRRRCRPPALDSIRAEPVPQMMSIMPPLETAPDASPLATSSMKFERNITTASTTTPSCRLGSAMASTTTASTTTPLLSELFAAAKAMCFKQQGTFNPCMLR